jgi:hypothetical protein
MHNATRNIDTKTHEDRAAGSFIVWIVLYAALMAAFMMLQNAPSLLELR